jgi:hypothetical protein
MKAQRLSGDGVTEIEMSRVTTPEGRIVFTNLETMTVRPGDVVVLDEFTITIPPLQAVEFLLE